MPSNRISSEFFNTDQQILHFVLKQDGESVTIEQVSRELDIPRSTASDHLNDLAKDGFLNIEKEGKVKHFYPEPDIAKDMLDSLSRLHSAYIYALREIKSKELQELEEIGDLEGDNGTDDGD